MLLERVRNKRTKSNVNGLVRGSETQTVYIINAYLALHSKSSEIVVNRK